MQRADAIGQVVRGDKLRVLPGYQQNVSESLRRERPRLAQHLLNAQSHPQNRVVPRKPAILAIVDALIGKVKRGKQSNHLAKPLPGKVLGPMPQFLNATPGCGRDEPRKILQFQRGFRQAPPNVRKRSLLGVFSNASILSLSNSPAKLIQRHYIDPPESRET